MEENTKIMFRIVTRLAAFALLVGFLMGLLAASLIIINK